MVVAALQTNGAEIGKHHRGIIGVAFHHAFGHPAVAVQPADDLDRRFGKPAGHLVQDIHSALGRVPRFLAAAVHYLLKELLMQGVHRFLILCVDKGQRFAAVIAEFLLDDKGGGHLIALVKVAVHNKAVQLRPQRNGLDKRRGDDVKHGIGEYFLPLVLLFQVLIDGGQVHPQPNVGLIIAAVRVDNARNVVQGIQLPQQAPVPAVSSAAFILLCHS